MKFNLTDCMVKVRDRYTQAVLPLSPSIVEVAGAETYEVMDDEDLKWIVAALGVGITLSSEFDLLKIENLRYWNLILVTEPTDEGRHIRKQVLSFFHQYMNPVLAGGHVYVVPSEMWSRMTPEEFAVRAMDSETREIVQIPGDWTLKEILESVEEDCG